MDEQGAEPEPASGRGGILRRSSRFRTLWSARVVSVVGDSVGTIALLLYTADSVGRASAVGLLMLAGDCLPSLLSPVLGAVGDRFEPRRVMLGCALLQSVLTGLIAALLPALPVLLALVAARATLGATLEPAARAAVPALVADRDLERANSVLGLGTHGLNVVGPVVAAALLPFVGIRVLLVIDAVTFLAAALLLALLPAIRPRSAEQGRPGLTVDAREGLRYVRHHAAIRVVAVSFCAVVACNAVDDVALVFLATDSLRASDAAASLLYAGAGIGLLVGYAVVARVAPLLPTASLLLLGYAVSSAGNLLTGAAWAVGAALGLQVVRGLGISAMEVGHATLVHRRVPPRLHARVFANIYGAVGLAAGLSYLLGGLLLDATTPRIAFAAAGGGGLAVTAVAAGLLPAALRRPGARGER